MTGKKNIGIAISDPGQKIATPHKTVILKKFKKFQINKNLMNKTGKSTYFLHCLPAHRGYEVTDEIIDGENSLVWSEAENRLYVHQAILLWCLKEIS